MHVMPMCLQLYHNTADCGGRHSEVSLLEIIDYLSPKTVNIMFHGCPPAMTLTEDATTYYSVTTGILYSSSFTL